MQLSSLEAMFLGVAILSAILSLAVLTSIFDHSLTTQQTYAKELELSRRHEP